MKVERRLLFIDDLFYQRAVLDIQDAIGIALQIRVVGDHDQSNSFALFIGVTIVVET